MIAKFAKRTTALVLSFLMLVTVFIPATAYADTGNLDDIKLSKEVDFDPTTNTGVITIEGYVEGEVIVESVLKSVPVDVILILDQSGSMDKELGGEAYFVKKGTALDLYNAGTLYAFDGTAYREVTKAKGKDTSGNNYAQYSGYTNYALYNSSTNRNNLYHKDESGNYHKVTLTRTQTNDPIFPWNAQYRYTYTCSSCGNKTWTSDNNGSSDNPPLTLYYPASTDTYTFTYKDSSGVTHSETCYAEETPATKYYTRSGNPTRKQALVNSATSFVDTIYDNAQKSGLHHRIGVIGFAGTGTSSGAMSSSQNIELFDGSTQINYEDVKSSDYGRVFKDMLSTTDGYNKVTASIGALAANGGTRPEFGFELANNLWAYDDAHPFMAEEYPERNRVIIFLTDGNPGNSSSSFDYTCANNTINQSNIAKNDHDAKVFSIRFYIDDSARVEQYMTRVSSEYTYAAGYNSNNSTWGDATKDVKKDSSKDPTQYFYKYSSSISLDDIFEGIAESVQKLLVTVELETTTIVRDIIAPEFSLPDPPQGQTASDQIEVYTADYLGNDEWDDEVKRTDITSTVDGKTIELTGFDFNKNAVTEDPRTVNNKDYRGQKLIMKIPFTVEESGFGGNHIDTNGEGSGLILNGEEDKILPLNKPFADVPLSYKMKTQDENIYYTNTVDFSKLITPYVDSANNEDYTADGKNNKYVDIVYTFSDASDATNATVATFTIPAGKTYAEGTWSAPTVTPTEDITYNVKCVITSTQTNNTTGEKSTLTLTDTAKVNIFKPTITFADDTMYLGESAIAINDNQTAIAWKHSDTLDTAVTMTGTKPTVTNTYAVVDSNQASIADNKLTPKVEGDIGVDVKTAIGQKDITSVTTFLHTDCSGKTCTLPEKAEFLVHVKTCSLTVTKANADPNDTDNSDTFVINVSGPNNAKYQVVLGMGDTATIKGLPVGTYTVTEDTNWAWRYTPSYKNGNTDTNEAALSADTNSATITVTNTKETNNWLDYSDAVDNLFTKDGGKS